MHLTATDLAFAYPGRSVLDGVNVRVSDGVRLGVVGENGTGKSTLLHLLAGDLTPSRGAVRRSGTLALVEQALVDSVYAHVLAWGEALKAGGYDVPLWRVHRGIGMGSDRIVPWMIGRHVDDADELSDGHKQRFLDMADTLRPTDGARELLEDLETRGVPFIIATSAGSETREALLEVLGRTDVAFTDSSQVDESKPGPDLLLASTDELGTDPAAATLVGDSPWDAEAARRIGMRAIAVRCGGFGAEELMRFGAFEVVDAPRDLIGRL